MLVPVPNRQAKLDWKVEGPKLRAKVFARLRAMGLGEVEHNIQVERHFGPDDYESQLNLAHGSAFGLAHNFLQVGPFRPANQDPRVPNLYFVGASTHPGTGLPLVMLSAKLCVERILGKQRKAMPWARSIRSLAAPLTAALTRYGSSID